VDVFVRVGDFERPVLQLFVDSAEAALDRHQLRTGDDFRGRQAACVGDAAGDVVWIELDVDLER
jgi:hypothetical protein